ncbi:MAG: M15 family metallopeptidase [Oscillospiraceae bacterium]|nr:M15 family metallopeptidase [Oscillospiraceae bacterium]
MKLTKIGGLAVPVAFLMTAVFSFAFFVSSKQPDRNNDALIDLSADRQAGIASGTGADESEKNQSGVLDSLALKNVSVSGLKLQNNLMLVNGQTAINGDFSPSLASAYPAAAVASEDIKIGDDTLDAVKRLFDGAKTAGFSDFFVNSGYRTYKQQDELYNSADDKNFVQKAGHSEHQTGLAVDIAYKNIDGRNFSGTGEELWLRENAWKYGFVLRYPENKTKTTGISYEPWHYRYVGLPHSYFCHKNSLCLEEYIDFLENGGAYTKTIENTDYTVYYEKPDKGKINVPEKLSYEVSVDNKGGYVITVVSG